MDPREELAALRRMAELEQKANSARQAKIDAQIAEDKKLLDPAAGMSTFDRFMVGAGAQADRALSGVKKLIPGVDESQQSKDDRAIYQRYRDNLGTAGALGEVATDVALTAIPVTRGMQLTNAGIRMLPRAAQIIGKGGVLPAALAGGTVSAALDPDSRGGAFAGGAAGGAIGQGVGNLLTKTMGGVVSNSVTPEAKALMDQGVSVPLWKATDSRILRDVAERAKVLPVVGNMMRGQERRSFEDFNRLMANRAVPNTPILDDAGNVLRWEKGAKVKGIGSDALEDLSGRFNNAYDALYKGRTIPIDSEYKAGVDSILDNLRNYKPDILGQVEGRVRQIHDPLSDVTKLQTTTIPTQTTNTLMNTQIPGQTIQSGGHVGVGADSIKEAIQKAHGEASLLARDGKNEAAQVLRDYAGQLENLRIRGLPPEVSSEAAGINKAYATYKQLQRANAHIGAQSAGVTSPRQMLNAVKAGDRSVDKGAFSAGNALNQQDVLRADQVLGSRIPEVGPGTAEKLLPAIGFGLPMLGYDAGLTALLGTKTGQKALMGQLPGQSAIRKYGNEYLVPALRSFGVAEGN